MLKLAVQLLSNTETLGYGVATATLGYSIVTATLGYGSFTGR